jgi:hypothetical protein
MFCSPTTIYILVGFFVDMNWIQMNFYPNPSGIASQETFLASHTSLRLGKNPPFEVISLLVPTGPL